MTVQQKEELRAKAQKIPLEPGVYLMKNRQGVVIYVGKSKKLRNRVSSYFTGEPSSRKTQKMVSNVVDFEYLICHSEMEALTLENNLIKKYSPKYNIKLKDDKSYPFIAITKEEYPRALVTRQRNLNDAYYFGPYSGMSVAYDILNTLKKTFSFPQCHHVFPKDIGTIKHCLYQQIGQCKAPCMNKISKEDYQKNYKMAVAFLRGEGKELVHQVTKDMQEAAEKEQFEKAAEYRDIVLSLQKISEKQKVYGDEGESSDIWAYYVGDLFSELVLLSIRNGRLLVEKHFDFDKDEISDEGLDSFFTTYYESTNEYPREICFESETMVSNLSLIQEKMEDICKKKVECRVPKIGEKRKTCEMAYDNAMERYREKKEAMEKDEKNLVLLARALQLEVVPERIEAYDISNIGDECITASMVVVENGKFQKRDYRQFRVLVEEKRDDYAAMAEALSRRLSHLSDGSDSLSKRPDLILLDGGKGQVSAVKNSTEIFEIPLFGMVKDDYHKTRCLTDGIHEISIAGDRTLYSFIFAIQEEAHRFAYTKSQQAKRNSMKHSSFEKIPGIGPKKAQILWQNFGSLKRLKSASEEEIKRIHGITNEDALRIVEYYHGKEEK